MNEINLTHLSVTLSGASLIVLLRVTYKFGQFMLEFKEMKARIRLHDKILKLPILDGE